MYVLTKYTVAAERVRKENVNIGHKKKVRGGRWEIVFKGKDCSVCDIWRRVILNLTVLIHFRILKSDMGSVHDVLFHQMSFKTNWSVLIL